ncbi:MAG: phosphatidylserine/phosphatidylglycerophosphate/cardiolipin synthase family protein [Bacteriovoracaceae bacterium]
MKLLLFLSLVFILSCTKESQRRPSSADQSLSWYPVYESYQDRIKKDPYLGLWVNSEHTIAYDLLNLATTSIEIEIYEMKDPVFRELLLKAIERGVRVRIVKDSYTVGDSCSELESISEEDDESCKSEKEFVTKLLKSGASYIWFNKKELCGVKGRSCYQHGKMLIVDKQYLLLSSGNFNSSSLCNPELKPDKCNRDYSFVTKNKKVIEGLSTVFDLDEKGVAWDFDSVLNSIHQGVTVSPRSLDKLVSIINRAKKSILVQNQYLEEPTINQALVQKAKEGIKVSVQVATFCNFGLISPTKREKIRKIYTEFQEAGIEAKVFNSKMLVGERPGYLHAKAFLIDDKIGWIGSTNGSETSTLQNREFGVLFTAKSSLRKLSETIKQDFDHPLSMGWEEALKCAGQQDLPRPNKK